MTFCTNCESTEPRTRYASNGELLVMGFEWGTSEYVNAQDCTPVCAECDCLEDTLQNFSEDDPREDR